MTGRTCWLSWTNGTGIRVGHGKDVTAHDNIVNRPDALERRYDDDKELRLVHFDQHKRLEERLKDLEESVSLLDKFGARRASVEEISGRLGRQAQAQEDRIEILIKRADMACERLAKLEARLAIQPDDFGGVTSTGEPNGKWWVIAKKGPPTMIFHPYNGFIRWEKATEYGWRERWRAQEVCDRLFERDEDVSVQEAMCA